MAPCKVLIRTLGSDTDCKLSSPARTSIHDEAVPEIYLTWLTPSIYLTPSLIYSLHRRPQSLIMKLVNSLAFVFAAFATAQSMSLNIKPCLSPGANILKPIILIFRFHSWLPA